MCQAARGLGLLLKPLQRRQGSFWLAPGQVHAGLRDLLHLAQIGRYRARHCALDGGRIALGPACRRTDVAQPQPQPYYQ